MKSRELLLGVLLISVILFACTLKAMPAAPEAKQALEVGIVPAAKAGWEAEWEKTLNLARKEGLVVISVGTQTVNTRTTISSVIKDKYDINIAWIGGRADERDQKIISERRAGIYSFDLGFYGGNPGIEHKNRGFLQSLRDALILPEVKDEKAWMQGKFPFTDKEGKYVFSFAAYPQEPFAANTDLLPNYKEEIGSYYDLLKPKWKGKILANDPTNVGSGQKWFSAMVEEDFGPILGMNYMRALAKQEPQISRDTRMAAEWMLKGKFFLGLNLSIGSQLADWTKQGIPVPVTEFTPKEGGYLTSGGQNFTFFDRAPHPNAAKIFLNWALSREGQILITKLNIKHSTRIDIPDPSEIDPLIKVRDPNIKYPMIDQEKYLEKTEEYTKLSVKIFGLLLK